MKFSEDEMKQALRIILAQRKALGDAKRLIGQMKIMIQDMEAETQNDKGIVNAKG